MAMAIAPLHPATFNQRLILPVNEEKTKKLLGFTHRAQLQHFNQQIQGPVRDNPTNTFGPTKPSACLSNQTLVKEACSIDVPL
jgi:hypothetical protein